ERVANQHIWTMFAGTLQRGVQFKRLLLHRERLRTWIAPGATGAIIGADTSKGAQLLLNQEPVKGKVAATGREHHRRTPFAVAVQVDTVAAYIHKLAQRSRCWFLPRLKDAGDCEQRTDQ